MQNLDNLSLWKLISRGITLYAYETKENIEIIIVTNNDKDINFFINIASL